jgi:alpha-glucosidase (family GH31 glycosyl hydrolase)
VAVPSATPNGNPILPPRWAFGTLWGTYADQNDLAKFGNITDDATNLRTNYEGDLLWIDSSWLWHDFAPAYPAPEYINFTFDPNAFPDPAMMISTLNGMHFHFGVWQWPWMDHGSALFTTAVSNRYFVMNGAQPAATSGGWHGDPAPAAFDFTNTATVNWWQGPTCNLPLANMGLEFWKLDTTVQQQESPFTSGGKAADPTKNYQYEYHLAAYQMSRMFALANNPVAKTVGSARGMIMAKTPAPASAAVCAPSVPCLQNDQLPGYWTDDTQAVWGGLGFGADMSRASQLNTSNTAAYWGGDTGGYNDTPTDELLIRWLEYSTFTPLQEYFGNKTNGFGNRYPWNFSTQAQTILETYNQLRYRLLPFRYNNAQTAYHAAPGKFTYPVQWFGGATALLVGDGSNTILVQPVTTQGATTANVALPAGNWIDWWTNQSFTGAAAVSAAIDQEPIFVKAGSILPMVGEYPVPTKIQWTDGQPNNPLTLRIYPAGKTTNLFYEDDGISEGYQNGAFSTTLFTSDNTSGHEVVTIDAQQSTTSFNGRLCQRTYILELPGAAAPSMVTRDGSPIAMSTAAIPYAPPTTQGWYYDATHKVLWVQFGPLASTASTMVSIQ